MVRIMKLRWILLLLCPTILWAQEVQWGFTLSSDNLFNPNLSHSMISRGDGSTYWVGHLEKRTMSYSQDHLGKLKLVRFDDSGNFLDSIFISGNTMVRNMEYRNGMNQGWFYFKDSLIVGNSSFSLPNQTGSVILSWNSSGNVQVWGSYGDTLADVTFANNGNAIGVAQYSFNGTQSLSEWDQNGNLIRQRSLPDMGFIHHIRTTPGGGLIINGSCLGPSFSLDTISIPSLPTYNNYILELDASWQAVGMKWISDITCQVSHGLIAPGGNLIYAGSVLMNQPQFDSLTYFGPNTSSEDFFLTSLDHQDWKFDWVQEVPSDTGFCRVSPGSVDPIGFDSLGNIYMVGQQSGKKAFWTPNDQTEPRGFSDILILSYTSGGVFRWAMNLGSRSIDHGGNLIVNGVDDLLLCGIITDSLFLPNDTIPAGFNSTTVIRITPGNLGLEKTTRTPSISFYPNPSRGLLEHDSPIPVPFKIIDTWGRMVLEDILVPGKRLDLRELPSGVYLLRTGSRTTRIILRN